MPMTINRYFINNKSNINNLEPAFVFKCIHNVNCNSKNNEMSYVNGYLIMQLSQLFLLCSKLSTCLIMNFNQCETIYPSPKFICKSLEVETFGETCGNFTVKTK